MKEKHLSDWFNEYDADFMALYKLDGVYYGAGGDFDFERKTLLEAERQLRKWGYKKIS